MQRNMYLYLADSVFMNALRIDDCLRPNPLEVLSSDLHGVHSVLHGGLAVPTNQDLMVIQNR